MSSKLRSSSDPAFCTLWCRGGSRRKKSKEAEQACFVAAAPALSEDTDFAEAPAFLCLGEPDAVAKCRESAFSYAFSQDRNDKIKSRSNRFEILATDTLCSRVKAHMQLPLWPFRSEEQQHRRSYGLCSPTGPWLNVHSINILLQSAAEERMRASPISTTERIKRFLCRERSKSKEK